LHAALCYTNSSTLAVVAKAQQSLLILYIFFTKNASIFLHFFKNIFLKKKLAKYLCACYNIKACAKNYPGGCCTKKSLQFLFALATAPKFSVTAL
jgi:hypothetical protein